MREYIPVNIKKEGAEHGSGNNLNGENAGGAADKQHQRKDYGRN